MFRRLAGGAALLAAASTVLLGCTPPAPTETDSQLMAEVTDTLESFYQIVDDQFEAGVSSPEAFRGVAAPDLATAYSSEVQAQIEEGVSSRGVPEVTDVELAEREASDFLVHFCTDGRSVQTTTPTGPVVGQIVAWTARLERHSPGALVMSELDVRGDESLCGQ